MHTRAHTRRKRSCARLVTTKWVRARLRLVYACVCTDLYEKFVGSSLLSYKLKFQILLRSELSLRRYLQNHTLFKKLSIFNVFSIFSQLYASTSWANARVKLHSQVHFGSKNILSPKILGPKKF